MNKVPKERRKYPRAKQVLTIYHRLTRSKVRARHENWHVSLTDDLSLGGVLFASEVPYNVRDILDLKIVMSGALTIYEGSGKVVRVERKRVVNIYKIAIYFTTLKNLKKTFRRK